MTTIGLSYSLVKISTKCAPALDPFRRWKAQQQVAVMLILLLALSNFARQAFGDGVRQSVEFIQNGDDAGLFFRRWHGNFELP